MQGTENFTLNATKTSILTSTNMLGGDATEYFPDEKGNFNLGDTSQVMYKEYKVGTRVFDKAVALKTLKPATVQSDYKFLEGENGSWTQNSDGTLRFRADGEFSKFTEVKVDGILVSADNYTAQSGSTIIILKSSYLKSLSAGTHKITVVYTDGECSANFEVKQVAEGTTSDATTETNSNASTAATTAAASDTTAAEGKAVSATATVTKAPKTGDNSNPLVWIVLLVAACGGMAGCTVYGKRKHK